MSDYLEIGPCPPDEECVQVGVQNYHELAWKECNRYIQLLRSTFGEEPPGCRLSIRTNPHEHGSYLEVACYYKDRAGLDYALKCEGEGPAKWTEDSSSSEL